MVTKDPLIGSWFYSLDKEHTRLVYGQIISSPKRGWYHYWRVTWDDPFDPEEGDALDLTRDFSEPTHLVSVEDMREWLLFRDIVHLAQHLESVRDMSPSYIANKIAARMAKSSPVVPTPS